MISIIDYDAGNIKSVEKAISFLGSQAVITRDRDEILSSEGVILPGVGSFGDAMEKLKSYELIQTIYDYADSGKPFLGICLGLQLMFKESEENFVHSYYLRADNPDDVAARTNYNVQIDAAVEKANVMACQFHPEKSSDVGLKILTNFIKMTEEGK